VKLRTIIVAAFAALLATVTLAQQQPQESWSGNGTLAFGYYHTTQNTFVPVPSLNSTSTYNTIFGEARLDLNGFLKDPQLLPFTVNFDGLEGSNDVDVNSYRNSLHNWGFTTTFLPSHPYPLRVFYQRSQFSADGSVFGQNADTSNLGLNWTLRETNKPHVNVDFIRYTNRVHLVTSLFDTNYDLNRFALGVDDTWKGWGWTTNFEHYQNVSNFADFLSLPQNYRERLDISGFRVQHSFWDEKAKFHADSRNQWRLDEVPSLGSSNSGDSYNSAVLNILHSSKLSTTYFYNYAHVYTGPELLPGTAATLVSFLLAPSFNSHYAGARLDYRWTKHVRFFEEVRYQYATPPPGQTEYQQSLTESLSGLGSQTTWHQIDLDATYVGHYQFLGTNFGNHQGTFSNDFFGRIAWGDVRRVRLSANGDYSRFNLVQQLNGFSEDRRIRVEAETRRWNDWMFRLYGERSYIELLNLAGDIRQDTTGLGFQVDHPRFSLSGSHSMQDGAGALFPVSQQQLPISEPLPTNLLFGTPLLDRNARSNAATLILKLRPNLDFNAQYRDENDILTATRFYFQEEDVRIRYRLGRVSMDLGYGRFRNDSFLQPNSSGLRTNRILFRIARDFRFL